MLVKIDADACIGCGLCANIAPDIFEMVEDKAIVKSETVPEAQEENARQMAEDCPVNAITVE